ncbi:MAG: Uma2 family endonuclease [Leptolyngbya sp. RL_3_1]|nr:Uma2 family endonuclease [Leptolyngbya sp. RL_3_1]
MTATGHSLNRGGGASDAVPSLRLGTRKQRQKFPPIAPDFVLELRSRTDRLATLRAKLQGYIAGTRKPSARCNVKSPYP